MGNHARSRYRPGLVGLAAACLVAIPAGCGETSRGGETGAGYKVVTTIGMVADIVREVAGDKATVVELIGTGVDPHLFKPTRADVTELKSANIIFYCGLMLEGKMSDTLHRLSKGDKPVHAVTELLDPSDLLAPERSGGHPDPHVWMDVQAWSKSVDVVAAKLAEFDPENADCYKANASAYRARLEELDAYVERVIQSIPEDQRVLITAHDAFNYFGRRYGLEVRGIQGLSTESEAGIRDVNRLVDLIVERGIQAVFVETSVPEGNVRALIEGARNRGQRLVIGGSLFSDAMGEGGTYEGTYIGMIDHNATVIARALGGRAPERGMHGKLQLAHTAR